MSRFSQRGCPSISIALALTAAFLAACGSSAEPSRGVTGLTLAIQSAEWEADRNFVVVGENASAEVESVTEEGCSTEVPCPISADVELRSSDPAVLSPLQLQARTPASVALAAHAPGTAAVTVATGGLTESRRVDVVARPLPLDALRVTLVTEWNDLPVQYDLSNNLTWVEIPRGQYAAFEVQSLRSGTEVFGAPVFITPYASQPPITEATANCRPTRIDIQCEVVHDIWIYGMASGDDQITVRGRSTCLTGDPGPCPSPSSSFTAHVVESQ